MKGKKIHQTKWIPFSNFISILSCYTVKRSRYTNSSHTKYAFEKQPYLPSKSLKKKKKPWNSLKSKPAPFQVFYTTRSVLRYILKFQQLFLKSHIIFNIQKKIPSYLIPWVFMGNYPHHHICAVPQESTSPASLQEKKKKLYNLHKLHLLHIPKITGSQYGSYQFTNRWSFKICAPHQNI